MTPDEVMQTLGQLVSVGFAVWYAWWTTTHTIPKMQDSHDTLIERLVAEFRSDTKDQRSDFLDRLKTYDASHDRMCDAITELQQAIKSVEK